MMITRYKKATTLLVFVFALSLAFYVGLGHISSTQGAAPITLCASGDFTNCATIDANVPNVRLISPFSQFAVTAMRIPVGRSVTYYAQINYQEGNIKCVSIGPGDYSGISGNSSDQLGSILSIKVDTGALPGCQTNITGGNQTRYSCRASDGACIVDPSGGYTNSNCDNACDSAGGGKVDDLPGIDLTIEGVFNIIYGFACWLWSVAMVLLVIFIIIAGLRFMYAGAEPDKFTTAKQNFKYVILGAIVVMGTFVIISTIAYNIGVDISFIPFDCAGGGGTINENACTVDSDCPTGQVCSGGVDSGGFGDGACVPAGDATCTVDSDCAGGQICNDSVDYGGSGNGTCVTGSRGGTTFTHLECDPIGRTCRQVLGGGSDFDGCTAVGNACAPAQ